MLYYMKHYIVVPRESQRFSMIYLLLFQKLVFFLEIPAVPGARRKNWRGDMGIGYNKDSLRCGGNIVAYK
jgi:hypothetical protein